MSNGPPLDEEPSPRSSHTDSLLLQTLTDISALRQQLGVLQGQSNLILRDLQDASASRVRLHEKVENLVKGQAGLEVRIRDVEDDLKKLSPKLEALEDAAQQRLGVARFIERALGWITSGKALIAALLAAASGGGAWWWWKH